MAEITIKSSIDSNEVTSLLNQIYKVCDIDPMLSPRPLKELVKAYENKNLLVAVEKQKVVGWVLLIPYTQEFQELAAVYVSEQYRSKGVFSKLLEEATVHKTKSAIITFNYPFANYLLNKAGFKNSSLWEMVKLSRGKFILNRLNMQRLSAIKKHYQDNKPICTLYTKI